MSTKEPTGDGVGEPKLGFSIRRSLVTPYVPYTVYVLSYVLFGIALGTVAGTFNPLYGAAVGASIWFGLEGLHAIDLADDGVATRLNNPLANALGYAQVAVGSAIGVWIAYATTWWYLALVAAGAILGLAYNEEWFDGLLHDRDKITGLANFGVCWGSVPFLSGFFVMSPNLSIGALVVASGVAIDSIRLNFLEGHGKLPRYEDVGIEHTRDHPSSCDEARAACHKANVINIGAWALVGIGATILFVV